MKKLLISLIISSILIGVGTGIFILELSEYSVHEYRQDIVGSSEKVYTHEYDGSLDDFSQAPLTINVNAGYYHYLNGKTEVILDETVKQGFEVDLYYVGDRPNVSLYSYSTHQEYNNENDGYDEYGNTSQRQYNETKERKISAISLSAYQSSFMPKDFFDFARYMTQNKVFVKDASNFIVEKVVIRTAQPEKIKVEVENH